jgi:hypothetical protein
MLENANQQKQSDMLPNDLPGSGEGSEDNAIGQLLSSNFDLGKNLKITHVCSTLPSRLLFI